MKLYKITWIIFFLSLSSFLSGQALFCTIKASKKTYKKGETPKIAVKIKNNTDSIIHLVKVLDGSNLSLRYPYAYFKIEKIADTSYHTEQIIRCGNMNGIDSSDFVKIKPGKSFSPYKKQAKQSQTYPDLSITSKNNFQKEGKYKITFYYSTNESDFKKWMGDLSYMWFDSANQIKPEYKERYQKLRVLFAKVPRLDLVSNEIIIEVGK